MKRLSVSDKIEIKSLLETIYDALEWDEDTQTFTDGGRILVSLDEDERKHLGKIIEKLA